MDEFTVQFTVKLIYNIISSHNLNMCSFQPQYTIQEPKPRIIPPQQYRYVENLSLNFTFDVSRYHPKPEDWADIAPRTIENGRIVYCLG